MFSTRNYAFCPANKSGFFKKGPICCINLIKKLNSDFVFIPRCKISINNFLVNKQWYITMILILKVYLVLK